MVPKDAKVPAEWIMPLDLTKPLLTDTQPCLQHAHAQMDRFLALRPGAPPAASPEVPEPELGEARCELCASLLGLEDGVQDVHDRECVRCHVVVCHRATCWRPGSLSTPLLGTCHHCVESEQAARLEELLQARQDAE